MSSPAETTSQAPPGLGEFEGIADVPIILRAELDRHTITLRALVELKVGGLLTLPKATGENIDLYAGDVLIGSAEVLVIDGVKGVRIADLRDLPVMPAGEET